MWLSASGSLFVSHLWVRLSQVESLCCWDRNLRQPRASVTVWKSLSQARKWG